jgi:hypothetical protein
MEGLVKEFGSEFRVEWTAIRDKGTCFSDITNKSLLLDLESGSILDPSFLVIFKRVDESGSLVHLLLSLKSFLFEFILLLH